MSSGRSAAEGTREVAWLIDIVLLRLLAPVISIRLQASGATSKSICVPWASVERTVHLALAALIWSPDDQQQASKHVLLV